MMLHLFSGIVLWHPWVAHTHTPPLKAAQKEADSKQENVATKNISPDYPSETSTHRITFLAA